MAYDSAATRQRILAAAMGEFAEYGIAGARVDRIASRAQANKQAIYAYFGNKEKLFERVLQQAMSELIEEIPVDPDDLGGYAARLSAHHRKHPEFVRLLLWEGLEYGEREVPAESDRLEHHDAKVRAVAAAQREGRIDDRIEPGVLVLFVVSLANWAHAVPQISRMLGADVSAETFGEQLATAVRRMARPADL